MLRTHDAGTLRASDAGSTVTLAGWVARRRDHGGVVFLDLRDASGYVQVVVREEEAHHLRNEYCVLVTGEVRRRPEGNENPELPTGEIEVAAAELRVLSSSAPLPFPIETDQAASDDVRYRYRYLDLRRQSPAQAIRLRSEVSRIAREVAEIAGPDVTTAAFALRWVIDQAGVTTVIPGARNVQQALGNVAAANIPPLTAGQLADLERLYDERIRAHVHDRW